MIRPVAASAMLIGDRLALRRIVSNLVGNAIKYGRAAHVVLDVEGRWIVLTVDDDEPGIPAAGRELLFEPFVRLDASRARKTGGAGPGRAWRWCVIVEAQGAASSLATPQEAALV